MKGTNELILGMAFFIANSKDEGRDKEAWGSIFLELCDIYIPASSGEINFWKDAKNLMPLFDYAQTAKAEDFKLFINAITSNTKMPKEVKDVLNEIKSLHGLIGKFADFAETLRPVPFYINMGFDNICSNSPKNSIYLAISALSSIGIIGVTSLPIFGESSNYLKAFMGAVSLPLFFNLQHDAHATNGKSLWKPVSAFITCASVASFLYAPRSSACIALVGFAMDFVSSGFDSKKTAVDWKLNAEKVMYSPF